jgi:hypothetical protein
MNSTLDIDARLDRVARIVVGTYDHAVTFDPPNFDATGRATVAVAIWEALTGMDDAHEAIDYARHVVAHGITPMP